MTSRAMAVCQEYASDVQLVIVAPDKPPAYVMELDAKYFRELFDRMKDIGYVCASATRINEEIHEVAFSPMGREYDVFHRDIY